MRIAVMADTHDNLPNIKKAMDIAIREQAGAVLHAGDIISPFAAKLILQSGIETYAVFGNNDGEHAGLSKILDISEGTRKIELEGKSILLCHDPAEASDEEKTGVDAFVYGHTHEFRKEERNGRLELNPGEAGGWLYGTATFAILDLETLEVERIEI